jgi:hypothetical protein
MWKVKETSTSAVLVTNSIAVTTGGTRVKSKKFAGSENPSWIIVRRNTTKIKYIFPFLTLMDVRRGLEGNKYLATKCDWRLNAVYIVLIYIQQQMDFILKYPCLTVSDGIIYSAYRGFVLYCDWNRLTAEILGTFWCKGKVFRNRVRMGSTNGWSEMMWGEMER